MTQERDELLDSLGGAAGAGLGPLGALGGLSTSGGGGGGPAARPMSAAPRMMGAAAAGAGGGADGAVAVKIKRYEDVIESLKRLLEAERRRTKQARAAHTAELAARTELQALLRQCVEDVRERRRAIGGWGRAGAVGEGGGRRRGWHRAGFTQRLTTVGREEVLPGCWLLPSKETRHSCKCAMIQKSGKSDLSGASSGHLRLAAHNPNPLHSYLVSAHPSRPQRPMAPASSSTPTAPWPATAPSPRARQQPPPSPGPSAPHPSPAPAAPPPPPTPAPRTSAAARQAAAPPPPCPLPPSTQLPPPPPPQRPRAPASLASTSLPWSRRAAQGAQGTHPLPAAAAAAWLGTTAGRCRPAAVRRWWRRCWPARSCSSCCSTGPSPGWRRTRPRTPSWTAWRRGRSSGTRRWGWKRSIHHFWGRGT